MKHFSWVLIFALFFTACNMDGNRTGDAEEDKDTTAVSDYPEHGVKFVPIEAPDDTASGNEQELETKNKELAEEITVPETDREQANKKIKVATPESGSRTEARKYFNEGIDHTRKQRYTEGIESFNKVLEIEPENSKAFYNRGVAYYRMKSYNEAEQDFKKAISINENDSLAYRFLGKINYHRGNYPAAITSYNKSLEIAPRYDVAYYERGIAKGQLGKYEEAVADFNEALSIDPFFHEAIYNRGLAKFFLGDTTAACTDWQSAKELGSSSAVKAVNAYCNRIK